MGHHAVLLRAHKGNFACLVIVAAAVTLTFARIYKLGRGPEFKTLEAYPKPQRYPLASSLEPLILKHIFERHCNWTPTEQWLENITSTDYAVPELVAASMDKCQRSSLPWTSVDLW
jgi:hypothetical protein